MRFIVVFFQIKVLETSLQVLGAALQTAYLRHWTPGEYVQQSESLSRKLIDTIVFGAALVHHFLTFLLYYWIQFYNYITG